MESNQVNIRMTKLNDAKQLLPLLEQLGYPQKIEQLNNQLQTYIESPNYGIFVAELKNKLVGFIAFSWRNLFISPLKKITIEGLVVDKNYRKKGIGKKLIQKLENYAQKNGITIIELTSGAHRAQKGTHDFYKSLGYGDGKHPKVYMRKELSL